MSRLSLYLNWKTNSNDLQSVHSTSNSALSNTRMYVLVKYYDVHAIESSLNTLSLVNGDREVKRNLRRHIREIYFHFALNRVTSLTHP